MMRTGQRSFVSPLMMTAALGIVFALARPVPAQDVPAKMGVPDDWTHHHLVFSNPGSAEDAMKNGAYDRWAKIVRDPRYILQQAKREAAAKTARISRCSMRVKNRNCPTWKRAVKSQRKVSRTPAKRFCPMPTVYLEE